MKSIIDKIYNSISNIDNERDYFKFHKNRYSFILEILKKLKISEGENLLDIGSHFLHILIGAKELNYDAYGIDLKLFVKLTETRAKNFDIILKECDLSSSDAPFKDNFFNFVLLNETLEHLNFHPLKVFKDIYRILKPGGKVVITTPNLTRLNNRIKFLLGKSIHHNIKENY
jgi:SAM-dependent methyltransferase